ncbi:nuclear pore complex protein DDB_G0274915 [Drosophila elegans]|uniref:nuclear pore complex protein DDB_G0274915 n=1 Tax=Drosophila elegans TaxID=30023 RepID=UPI0007E83AFE|nr:nuclear pore complex protein DDB_G0274915 [Drosophila elegans]
MWLYFVITVILAGSQLSNAFWWPKTTTETREPSVPVLQHIPLTYFRTYTYQPLGPGFFGFGAAQTPLLPGGQYDPYAVTSYAAARRHDSFSRPEVTPPAGLPSSSSSSSSTTSTTTTPAPTTKPTTTTTTSTTTTTTTPAPTTTSSTTTTTTTPPPPPRSTSSSYSEGSSTSSLMRFGEYPTYNRRLSNLYNGRPQYPYPDYFNYQSSHQNLLSDQGASGSRIQFVPCMCPVSVPSLVSTSPVATVSPHLATTSTSVYQSQPVARQIEGKEVEADADADGETESEGEEEEEDDGEEEQGQEEGATKDQPETQETTSYSPA